MAVRYSGLLRWLVSLEERGGQLAHEYRESQGWSSGLDPPSLRLEKKRNSQRDGPRSDSEAGNKAVSWKPKEERMSEWVQRYRRVQEGKACDAARDSATLEIIGDLEKGSCSGAMKMNTGQKYLQDRREKRN